MPNISLWLYLTR